MRRTLGDGARLLVDIKADERRLDLQTHRVLLARARRRSRCRAPVRPSSTPRSTTVNDDFLGTLGANLLIEPAERKKLGAGFDEAIARLAYGTIAINSWTGLGFLSAGAPWGAFPGHTLDNVQSGIGVVHNALLLDSPERTVVHRAVPARSRAPCAHGEFALFPKPPWFVTARSAATTGRRLTRFAAKPSWLKMPAIFVSAFRA